MDMLFESRVLVIAGDLLTRAGLVALLETGSKFDVVGQVAGGVTLSDDLDVYRPDVVVYDLGYEPLILLQQIKLLIEVSLPIVALLPDTEHAGMMINALKTGDAGYALLLRASGTEFITEAISSALAGLVSFDPELVDDIIPDVTTTPIMPPEEDLTPRESQVLNLLARGLTNKAIAQKLDISPNTVKFHVNAILAKLDAQSRTEAVVRATQLGLIVL